MNYLLKGIALLSALALVPLIRAEALEQAPLHMAFGPSQLQGETYIWQIAQTANGQVIAGGERLGYYLDNRWEFLAEPRRPAIHGLLVDGNNLWVASLNE